MFNCHKMIPHSSSVRFDLLLTCEECFTPSWARDNVLTSRQRQRDNGIGLQADEKIRKMLQKCLSV